MLSINTNLQSLIVQNNLTKSTIGLNQAIERMTTGFKINHASDNAANYSISQNMTSKLSSYEVAQDNVSMGMDLISTAADTISMMQSKGERLMALWTQAHNGTYGNQSIEAIKSEASAIVKEINRMYANTEYNDINVLEYDIPLPDWAETVKANAGTTTDLTPQYNGFIADPVTYSDSQIADMTALSTKSVDSTISKGTYKISSKEELKQLAAMANNGNITGGKFVLAADIDIGGEQWTPIGIDSSHTFNASFDGNGHKISGLTITPEEGQEQDYQGLFGYVANGRSIKNVALENVNVRGKGYTGGLVGYTGSIITNVYVTGSVSGTNARVGGLAGYSKAIDNCYTTISVTGKSSTGGLVGFLTGEVTNSYSSGFVTGTGYIGGLVGMASKSITNSYSTSNVTGAENVGGLVGSQNETSVISHCYATGSVTGSGFNVGGFVGYSNDSISTSYAKGSVTNTTTSGGDTGGFVGQSRVSITDCYSAGSVLGSGCTGGFAGEVSHGSVTNCYSTGSVSGTTGVGGFVGSCNNSVNTIAYNKTHNSELRASGSGSVSNVTEILIQMKKLQVGINGDSSNQIAVDTGFLNFNLNIGDISSESAYDTIKSFLDQLSTKATILGAAYNRLESALDSIGVSIDNLTSSRSTLRDADIAQESSQYIKNQILQQAAATLLATANQTPSIALQLI